MKKPKRTPEQKLIIGVMEAAIEVTKAVIDFQNKLERSRPKHSDLIITRHPIKLQSFSGKEKPPEPRTIKTYGKDADLREALVQAMAKIEAIEILPEQKTLRMKRKVSKDYIVNIFNKKKV